ncbi:MAG: transposase [Opitutaceae bacterium]
MKWLQSTFATRFNRFRNERGHAFQGRYKSIVVGEDRPLLGLIDYIHLNPVRAKLCDVSDLKSHALSSFPKYCKRTPPDGLCRGDFLSILGLPDSIAGMNRYKVHLAASEAKDPKARDALLKRYCRGWFIGGKEAKAALSKDLKERHPDVVWEGESLRELNEGQWAARLDALLKEYKKRTVDIEADAKGAAWKIEIARQLRKETTAKNPWIAKHLNMGHPSRVSNLISNRGC